MTRPNDHIEGDLAEVWREAVAACGARRLVAEATVDLALRRETPLTVLALGKAAGAMCRGALDTLGPAIGHAVVVTTADAVVPDDPRVEVLRGEHPLPGPGSFAAGERLWQLAGELARGGLPALGLVSGGGSSLAERPRQGLSAADLVSAHRALVASGAPIAAINERRAQLSSLKAGGLARALGPSLRGCLVLADVPSGRPEVVASGPLSDPTGAMRCRVLATPESLCRAAADAARARGLTPVFREGIIDGSPAGAVAAEICAHLRAARPGELWIAAGEVEVALPPGLVDRVEGGRARHLAALVLREMQGAPRPWATLCAGSDGRDGRGGAGALVTSRVVVEPGLLDDALARFDSGRLHRSLGTHLPQAPPTTNLTDLYLALPSDRS